MVLTPTLKLPLAASLGASGRRSPIYIEFRSD
jgi:hypothetical protein